MKEIFKKTFDIAEDFLSKESCGHDIHHAKRVFNNAVYINDKEENRDHLVVGLSSIMHDVCRPWEKKTGKSHFGSEALELIKSLLVKLELEQDVLEGAIAVIAKHDIYDWTDKDNTKSYALKILQDADNLDAMGAIGIARAFSFGGANKLLIFDGDNNFNFKDDFVENPNHRTTSIAHFYDKLLKLKDNMNTKTGKSLAVKRHKLMLDYLDTFFKEWSSDFS